MSVVVYSRSGRTSMRQVFAWLVSHDPDPEQEYATKTFAKILADLERIARNPLYGITYKGHPTWRYWFVADKKYKVHYDQLDETKIKVVLVRSVKQQTVSDEVLEKYFKMPPLK